MKTVVVLGLLVLGVGLVYGAGLVYGVVEAEDPLELKRPVTNNSSLIGGSSKSNLTEGFMGMFQAKTSINENQLQQAMPMAGIVDKFYVRTTLTGADPEHTITYIVRKNGADTTVRCIIADLDQCQDTTHSASFQAGDLIAVRAVRSGTSSRGAASWTAKFTP